MNEEADTIYTHRGIARSVELASARKEFDRYVQNFAIIIDGLFDFMQWPKDQWSFLTTVGNGSNSEEQVEADVPNQFVVGSYYITCLVRVISKNDRARTTIEFNADPAPNGYIDGSPISIRLANGQPAKVEANSRSSCVDFYKKAADSIRGSLCYAAQKSARVKSATSVAHKYAIKVYRKPSFRLFDNGVMANATVFVEERKPLRLIMLGPVRGLEGGVRTSLIYIVHAMNFRRSMGVVKRKEA